MAATQLELEVVTPERRLFSAPVDEVVLPGVEGYLGVLPGHAALLTELGVGEISFKAGGKAGSFVVAGGWCEIQPERVSILAERCERPEDIDVARARQSKERAEAILARADATEDEIRDAQAHLRRALVRLTVGAKGHGM